MLNKPLVFGLMFFLLLLVVPSFAVATNSTNSSLLNVTKAPVTLPIPVTNNASVNETQVGLLFHSFSSPFLSVLDWSSLMLFILVLILGEYYIYKRELEAVESGQGQINFSPLIIFAFMSLLILLFPAILTSYSAFVPSMLSHISNYNLAKSFSYETSAMLVIATVLSFASFILFLKAIMEMLVGYTNPEKRKEATNNLKKLVVILLFVMLSPYILIVTYLILSHFLLIVNTAFTQNLAQILTTTHNQALVVLYQSSYTGCSTAPAIWQVLQEIQCGANSGFYVFMSAIYPYGLQAWLYSSAIKLMVTGISSVELTEAIFSIMFGIIMIWSFAMVDYKLLQYVISFNTEGEKESFREVKARLLQYAGFLLSPAIYIIFIIIMSALLLLIVGLLFSTSAGTFSFSPIPPLFLITATPTVTNIAVWIAGFIGMLFLLILVVLIGSCSVCWKFNVFIGNLLVFI